MDAARLLALAGAILILAVSPGPGVLACVGKSLSSGFRRAMLVVAGIVLGDLIFLLMAVYGMTAVAQMMGRLFIVIKYAGGGYLIWCGLRTLRRGAVRVPLEGRPEPSWRANFLTGLFITLGNPKVILFYLAFLPTFIDLQRLHATDVLKACLIVATVLAAVLTTYALLADRARSLCRSPSAVGWMNLGAGTVMIGAGVAVLMKRT